MNLTRNFKALARLNLLLMVIFSNPTYLIAQDLDLKNPAVKHSIEAFRAYDETKRMEKVVEKKALNTTGINKKHAVYVYVGASTLTQEKFSTERLKILETDWNGVKLRSDVVYDWGRNEKKVQAGVTWDF